MIAVGDRLHLWKLVKAADMPRRELIPLLIRLGLPMGFDPATGDDYTSRTAFAALLRRVAGQ